MARLTFIVGSVCPGGNHYDVTQRWGAESIVLHIQHNDFEEDLTQEERQELARLLLHSLVRELPDRKAANVRSKLAASSIELKL